MSSSFFSKGVDGFQQHIAYSCKYCCSNNTVWQISWTFQTLQMTYLIKMSFHYLFLLQVNDIFVVDHRWQGCSFLNCAWPSWRLWVLAPLQWFCLRTSVWWRMLNLLPADPQHPLPSQSLPQLKGIVKQKHTFCDLTKCHVRYIIREKEIIHQK